MPLVRSFVFWKGGQFPLEFSSRHIWSKANRNIGNRGEQYEEIYELNGGTSGLVLRHAVIDSPMNASINSDVFCDHPCQKPIKLIRRILKWTEGDIILDPFLGSGTTAVAAKELGRRFIGIEISEEYCAIAVKRLRQGVLGFS